MSNEIVICPICDHDFESLWGIEFKGHRIVKCNKCSLRYVNPRRKYEENLKIYDTVDYFTNKDVNLEKIKNSRYDILDSITTMETICKFYKLPATFLDIGCGSGTLLTVAKQLSLVTEATGIDITSVNKNFIESFGIKFFNMDLTQNTTTKNHLNKYDIITAIHVLEHIAQPNHFLKQIHELLNKNGLVYLLLPNESSLNSIFKNFLSKIKLYRRPFKHLSPGHHLFFYDRNTSVKLLEKSGYRILSVGSRSRQKKRRFLSALIHKILEKFGYGSWLEIVCTSNSHSE